MRKIFFLVAFLSASILSFAIDSEYCGAIMSSGNTQAAFTWVTEADGSIVITISETLGGAAEATHFRGNGINIDKIQVGESREPAATYFSLACGGAPTITLSLIDPNNAPAIGTKIYVTNQIIEYTTSKDGNAWPTLNFEYTYGGRCDMTPELTRIVLAAASPFAQIGEGVALTATAFDQMNNPMDLPVTLAVTPASAGSIAGNIYTPAVAGPATITATCGELSESIVVYGVPSANLALNQPCEAGYEPANQGEISPKANDGDTNTAWVTYADRPAAEEWWIVDLGAKYTLSAISVLWGDPASTSYIVQARETAPSEADKADDTAWETIANVTEAGINSEQFLVVNADAQYVRLRSLTKSANFFRMKEVRVFGTEWVPSDDSEAPVMVSAEATTVTWNRAVISVAATDNIEVRKYHVVDAANSIDMLVNPSENTLVLTDLTPAHAYNLVITAVDAAGNESANNILVTFTTPEHLFAPESAAPAPTWPAAQVKAIYSPTYNANCGFGEWGSGTQVSDTEFGKKYVTVGGGYFGLEGFSINAITMEKLHFDFWIADDATIRIVPIWGGTEQGITINLVGGQWTAIDLDKEQYTGITDWSNIYQVKIDNASNKTFWMGNAYFYRTTELEDTEAPTNVAGNVSAFSYFSVTLALTAEDNMGVINFTVKNGEEVLATGGGASGSQVNVVVPNLLPNTAYNFSVIAADEKGNAAEPIAIAAQTLEAPAPAPVPDFTGMELVVPIYTDAREGGPAIGIGGWGQATQVSYGQLAEGDHVMFLSNTNYLGWELNPHVDATGTENLHVDFYATDMTNIRVTPISPGHEGIYIVDLQAGQWTSVDIPLSTYEANAIDWSDIFQFKFFDAVPAAKNIFIDNVYFYKVGQGSDIDNIQGDKVQCTKVIENGVLYLMRNGAKYNVQGVRVQ